MQLRSFYTLSIFGGAHVRKKYQGLSACTTSISRSRVEESGIEAMTNLPATHMVWVLYSSNALHGKTFAFLAQASPTTFYIPLVCLHIQYSVQGQWMLFHG